MLSPKQIGTICFTIFLLIFPAFATNPDIDTATASCNDGVFNSNSGPVDIEVNWEPNEINLRWYNNNTLITPSNNASNNCTYDEIGLTMPSAPTRTGYTFKGWRARPQYDFSTLTGGNGTKYWAKGQSQASVRCWKREENEAYGFIVPCSDDSDFYELVVHEWKVQFYWGDMYGFSKCSEDSGSLGNVLNNLSNTEGQYCWCKVTGYKPNNSNTLFGPAVSVPWGFVADRTTLANCKSNCSGVCAGQFLNYLSFRKILFGIN